MPIVAQSPAEVELEKVQADIEAVERKKLITLVDAGASDKVLFIQPFDLRGHDPEEVIEVFKSELVETTYDQGYAKHQVKQVSAGQKPRHTTNPQTMTGPFGYTHKINTNTQDGQREYETLKRTLQAHVSRLSTVPEFVPYHSEVNELGMLDLRNISISKEDVPVASLENYPPLLKLQARRDELLKALGRAAEAPRNAEEVEVEQATIAKCDIGDCEFVTKDLRSLGIHKTKMHGGKK